ncbi:MAG: hypothetical protein WBF21_00890 [Steroidobacteraceae bacterium]|jgi:hypothetical protein
MKIAKPMLLVSTPLGIVWGLVDAYRQTGGLVLLMAAMMGVVGAGIGMVVMTIRREEAAARAARAGSPSAAANTMASLTRRT